MRYLLLTGGTGLLGSYLVRDFLKAGMPLAVLARSTRMAAARHRVETQLCHWERQEGRPLPRPVVLVGDLSRSDLSLSATDTDWIATHCSAIFHNAASLSYVTEEKTGEPWRTNFEGTSHLLDFCRSVGIKEFHHVSTAYLCGLRTGTCYEHELDVGQEFGNPYEVSKIEAEKLVRDAPFLIDLTIYRPGIITGDSQTGYTSTFHGFYAPLKLVSALIGRTASLGASHEQLNEMVRSAGHRLCDILQMTGDERKFYAPVDWVSAAMVEICRRPELHGTTYHLTPREGVPVRISQQVMEDVFLEYTEQAARKAPAARKRDVDQNWAEFEQTFLNGMEVYRSHWRDDPQFDSTNTDGALPHLPCPSMDDDVLRRLTRYAIESKFGWPKPPIVKPAFDVHDHLAPLLSATDGFHGKHHGMLPALIGLQVSGSGGGEWTLWLEEGEVTGLSRGLSQRCTTSLHMNSDLFERMSKGEIAADRALATGQIFASGNRIPLPELANALETISVVDCHPHVQRSLLRNTFGTGGYATV